jgi:hypothetical protein
MNHISYKLHVFMCAAAAAAAVSFFVLVFRIFQLRGNVYNRVD